MDGAGEHARRGSTPICSGGTWRARVEALNEGRLSSALASELTTPPHKTCMDGELSPSGEEGQELSSSHDGQLLGQLKVSHWLLIRLNTSCLEGRRGVSPLKVSRWLLIRPPTHSAPTSCLEGRRGVSPWPMIFIGLHCAMTIFPGGAGELTMGALLAAFFGLRFSLIFDAASRSTWMLHCEGESVASLRIIVLEGCAWTLCPFPLLLAIRTKQTVAIPAGGPSEGPGTTATIAPGGKGLRNCTQRHLKGSS